MINTLNIIRNYARQSVRKRLANPGIQKQLNILQEDDEKNLEDVDVEELESDFMRLGDVHRQHEKEILQYRDKEKYWIIKRKYFKENQLNFLTWNDKEQIRHLHQSDPNEWTIEKLSEGFPALPDTIHKILKNKWHLNEAKKERHDQSVENNWKLLKNGKFDELPPELKQHLAKFTNRKTDNLNLIQNKKIIHTTKSKQGEFSSIIESYNKLKNKETKETIENQEENQDRIEEEYSSPYGNKMVPLRFIKKPEVKPEIEEAPVPLDTLFHGKKDKYLTKTNKFVTTKQNNKIVEYPEKITIPKNKYRKGSTYKVNDCYYDDDGLFLYRVPGMY